MKLFQNQEITGSIDIKGDIYVPSGSVFGTASFAHNAISGGYVQNESGAIIPNDGGNYTASYSDDVILGGNNQKSIAGIIGNTSALLGNGGSNTIQGASYSTILNGQNNLIDSGSSNSTILAGTNSQISDSDYSTIFGNNNSIITTEGFNINSSILGGEVNTITNSRVATIAGRQNTIENSSDASIIGYSGFISSSNGAFIAGYNNEITGSDYGIAIGKDVKVHHTNASVIGNSISSSYSDTLHVNNLSVEGTIYGYSSSPTTISGSAPSGSFETGSLWWNDNDGNAYVYVSESTWVPLVDSVAGANYGNTLTHYDEGTTWNVNHNLNTTTPLITVYSGSSVMVPASITSVDANNTTITFAESVSGSAVLSTGIGKESTELAVTASYATTASYLAGDTPAYVFKTTSNNQPIPHNTVTQVTNWEGGYDTSGGQWNDFTGTFTAAYASYYKVTVNLLYAASVDAVSNEKNVSIYLNSTSFATSAHFVQGTGSTFKNTGTAHCIVYLTPGDTITIRAFQNTGIQRNIHTSQNFLSIEEIPGKITR